MEVKIRKNCTFATGLNLENNFCVNLYNFEITMNVYTDDTYAQNIAVSRLDFFLDILMEDSVIVCADNTDIIQKYTDAGLKVCTTPEQPYDQIVAMVVLLKLNTIMEGHLFVTDIHFTSALGNGITFELQHELAEAMTPIKGWWTRNDMSICDMPKEKSNVIELKNPMSWESVKLSFKNPNNEETVDTTVE
jgi:hypothetical protein